LRHLLILIPALVHPGTAAFPSLLDALRDLVGL
jgi:hypothetical protein